MMNFTDFIQWVFYGVVGGSAVYGVSILSHLKNSIDDLNIKMAKLIEKNDWHEKMIERLEKRVEKLEESA